MDINHIELPDFVIANLYHSSLIEPGEIPASLQPFSEIPGNSWKSLGENRKNILIVVDNKDVVHLPDDELCFLTGILTACKLNIADVTIFNFNNQQKSSYKELIAYFKSKSVLLFGVEPKAFGLPISFPHFQVQSFANNSFLFSPPLKELENNKLLKSKLWVCLRRLFGI